MVKHCCEYSMGILERGCGQEADKARSVAEYLDTTFLLNNFRDLTGL